MQKDPTEIDVMSKSEHRALCALVANVIGSLEWRENGLGLMQAYLAEGTEREMRVHIWHPLLLPKFEFHESFSCELCITVIEKVVQEAAKARIMWPSDRELVHAFGGEPSGQAEVVLAQAKATLLKYWAMI